MPTSRQSRTFAERQASKRRIKHRRAPNTEQVLRIPTTTAELREAIQELQSRIDTELLQDRLVCPVCLWQATSRPGLTNHMSSAKTCSWFKFGKLQLYQSEDVPSRASTVEPDLMDIDDPLPPRSLPPVQIGTTLDLTRRQRRKALKAAERRAWLDSAISEVQSNAIDEPVAESLDEPLDDHSINLEEEEEEEEETLAHLWQRYLNEYGNPLDLIGEEDPMPEDRTDWAGPSTNYAPRENLVKLECPSHTRAGETVPTPPSLLEDWRKHGITDGASAAPYAPFKSEMDWKVADWMVRDSSSQAACDCLLHIPGVLEKLDLSFKDTRTLYQKVDAIVQRFGPWRSKILAFPDTPDEMFTVRYRDSLQAVRALLGDPTFAKDIVYRPAKLFRRDGSGNQVRTIHEMWTGDWCWTLQNHQQFRGKTIAPVIIATDKTQLAPFGKGKVAYPVYLTLGNIPRHIRRKPSRHACVLIGYLPTTKINHTNLTENMHKSRTSRLFHDAMRIIPQPLKDAAAKGGEIMLCADGQARQVIPILATYAADYPEQCLVSCTKYLTCCRCKAGHNQMGLYQSFKARTSKDTLNIIRKAKAEATSHSAFYRICLDQNVGAGVLHPFWDGLPFVNIHLCMTADVLHQLHQGVLKHLVTWVEKCMTPKELDARFRCLPPAFGVFHFKDGISTLGQVTGSTRKNMAKVLLGCLVGSDKIGENGIRAAKAILDFIYLAQYSSHDDITLKNLEDALREWHRYRDWFMNTVEREDLNIPKFHTLHHYVQCIKDFGTTDNYNTDTFERFHIDFAKKGWRASNKRNEVPQMMRWVERQEKLAAISRIVEHVEQMQRRKEKEDETGVEMHKNLPLRGLARQGDKGIVLSKSPSTLSIDALQQTYHSPTLKRSLTAFLKRISNQTRARSWQVPFSSLRVYKQFKLVQERVDEEDEESIYTIKASPLQQDPVIVLADKSAGSEGLAGCRVGRIKVIFCLPERTVTGITHNYPKIPLAHIEWYTKLKDAPEDLHGMYIRKPSEVQGVVVPLIQIHQGCMLFPDFTQRTRSWTSNNVLDLCDTFLVNHWQSKYTYKTLW